MRVISADELASLAVEALGLDPKEHAITSMTTLAAAVRRAAGFLCPCPTRTLVDAVLDSLRGLAAGAGSDMRTTVEDCVEGSVAQGDLLEAGDTVVEGEPSIGATGSLLYAAPPRFVWRRSGAAFLLGVAPDGEFPLPSELMRRVVYREHVRRVIQEPSEDLRAVLTAHEMTELSEEVWLRLPPVQDSSSHVAQITAELIPIRGELPELSILDPAEPVRYYRGRWQIPKDQTGNFVARRGQRYGNPLWCYVQLERGHPTKLRPFPTPDSGLRGCDEAWHLQAAIDSVRREPQQIRVTNTDGGTLVEFFSPVPAWAERRWNAVGQRASRKGSLFGYEFSREELGEEIEFCEQRLWLASL